jgi:hypothetical protein
MRWRKLGQVFTLPEHRPPWMASHASNPVPEVLGGDCFRVYFGCRDRLNRSHIAYVDLSLTPCPKVLDMAAEPVVAPGAVGAFDDSGTSMACLVHAGEHRFLYYVGWNLGVTVPWRNSIGLAISAGPGKPFVKQSRAPILDRSDEDPFSLSYPWVIREQRAWRMWYGSNLSWGARECDMKHAIKYAESEDGIHWRRTGRVILELDNGEYALSRPCVRRIGSEYEMWFCHRGAAYRIGFAESPDGCSWTRCPDGAGIDVSAEGWDSQMLCYPCVFDYASRTYMLYNGNDYGRHGFGLAVLEAAVE